MSTTPADLEKFCAIMAKHNLLELHVGDLHIRRAPPEPPAGESPESAFERLRKLRPDAQDAALLLAKTGGG